MRKSQNDNYACMCETLTSEYANVISAVFFHAKALEIFRKARTKLLTKYAKCPECGNINPDEYTINLEVDKQGKVGIYAQCDHCFTDTKTIPLA